jgi:hypothetical protein
MISPTDTAYRLLPTSLSARELMDAYTPGLFELKFAEERTRQAAPRVGLLVLLKTFQQLGYFVKVADVPDSVLRQVAEAAGYDGVPRLDDYDRGTLRVRHMALVRSWMGVSAFDREALRIIVKACVEASRVREDLADIINVAIEELLRKRFELPGFTTLFRAARTARATVNRSFYDRMSQALDPPTKARIDSLFDKEGDARQTPWDTVKIPDSHNRGKRSSPLTHRSCCSTPWLASMNRGTNPAIEIQAVESLSDPTRRSDVFLGGRMAIASAKTLRPKDPDLSRDFPMGDVGSLVSVVGLTSNGHVKVGFLFMRCSRTVSRYLGRAMADPAPAARPGCDKFKTSCLIP